MKRRAKNRGPARHRSVRPHRLKKKALLLAAKLLIVAVLKLIMLVLRVQQFLTWNALLPLPRPLLFLHSRALMYPPSDLLRGRDVFVESLSLDDETENSRLSHYAPNCATFSRAREFPSRGSRIARNLYAAWSIFVVYQASLLSLKRRTKIGYTRMADLAAEKGMAAADKGDGFSLERLLNSIAWSLD